MKNYRALQKHLESNGNETVKLSFDNLKEILCVDMDYAVALRLQKEFRCSYMVNGISERGKWVSFRRTDMQNDDDCTTITTLASILWW